MPKDIDTHFMKMALRLADKAASCDEVPVGAIVTLDDRIIGKGHNLPITKNDPSAHAEVIAIRQAARKLQNYRLLNTTLYTTLEPCPMCAGLIVHARIKRLVIAAKDSRTGCCGSVFDLTKGNPLNHKVDVSFGLCEKEASQKLKDFFKARRKN